MSSYDLALQIMFLTFTLVVALLGYAIERLKDRVRILEGHMCEMYRRDTPRRGRG